LCDDWLDAQNSRYRAFLRTAGAGGNIDFAPLSLTAEHCPREFPGWVRPIDARSGKGSLRPIVRDGDAGGIDVAPCGITVFGQKQKRGHFPSCDQPTCNV
jgi:hypothetical protein